MLPPGPKGVSGLSLLPTAPGAQPKVFLLWKVPPPAATTRSPTAIKSTGAVLHGTVNPDLSQVSACYFTVTPASAAGSKVFCSQQLGGGGVPRPVSAVLVGLKPSTKYTVRLVAVNAQGVSTGAPITFKTHPPPPRLTSLGVPSKLHKLRAKQTITVGLSQPAKLTLTYVRLVQPGMKPFVRTQSVVGRRGRNVIAFHGAGMPLGRYRLTVKATDVWGQIAAPKRARLRLVQ
jgi:hypothetical protein